MIISFAAEKVQVCDKSVCHSFHLEKKKFCANVCLIESKDAGSSWRQYCKTFFSLPFKLDACGLD
jgi:hypothetical protein